jgi:hypothetical protein
MCVGFEIVYTGSASEIEKQFINTDSFTGNVGYYGSASLAAFGLKAGVSGIVSPAGTNSYLIGTFINAGFGYPSVGQVSVGTYNTYTLYDFY